VILHPDHLLSSTVVADSFSCTRRAVLQDRIKATNDSSAPLVYGTILHEIFQAAMLANRWDTEWLMELVQEIATRHLEDLYTIKLQTHQAVEYLLSKMPELQSWAELFVSSQPHVSIPLYCQLVLMLMIPSLKRKSRWEVTKQL
jgi:DNA replication ATP-dependent helicase Dna2